MIERGAVMEEEVSATETCRSLGQMPQEQSFALIDQVQERTCQVPVIELEEAIAEAVDAAKQEKEML